jgi:hypothetical protein
MRVVASRWTVAVVLIAVASFSLAHAGKIYWSGFLADASESGTFRANLDGTSIERIGAGMADGLAVDPVARKLYWGNHETGGPSSILFRSNLDGTNPQVVHDLGGPLPTAIALDLQAGWAYLSASYVSSCAGILRGRMDGTGAVEELVPEVCAEGVAVDPGAGKIYWAEVSPKRAIRRANLDGTVPEDVIDLTPGSPKSLALDANRGKIYWSINSIFRAGTDGSDIEQLIPESGYPEGIALDLRADKLYWFRVIGPGSFHRADLDGSNAESFLSGVQSYGQIAIDPVPDGVDVPAVSLRGLLVLALLLLGISALILRKRGSRRREA